MIKQKSLAEQWQDFAFLTGVAFASNIQRQEMRRAFYAGAASIFDAMMIGLDEDHEPTVADMNYMTSLADEMERFGKDIAAGKA